MQSKEDVDIPAASSLGEIMANPFKYMVRVGSAEEKQKPQKTAKKNKAKKKRGRPKKYSQITQLKVYVDREMKERLKRYARQQHNTLTGVVQGILGEWMNNGFEKQTQVRKGKYEEFKKIVVTAARNQARLGDNHIWFSIRSLQNALILAGVQPRMDTLARYLLKMRAEHLVRLEASTVSEAMRSLNSFWRLKFVNFKTAEELKKEREYLELRRRAREAADKNNFAE